MEIGDFYLHSEGEWEILGEIIDIRYKKGFLKDVKLDFMRFKIIMSNHPRLISGSYMVTDKISNWGKL